MNYSDLRFIIIVIGIGMGLGIALAQRHGFMGFLCGFGLVTVIAFTLLTLIRLLSTFSKKRKK